MITDLDGMKKRATELFYKYRKETEHHQFSGVDILALISAGKAIALSELLEEAGVKLDPEAPDQNYGYSFTKNRPI